MKIISFHLQRVRKAISFLRFTIKKQNNQQ